VFDETLRRSSEWNFSYVRLFSLILKILVLEYCIYYRAAKNMESLHVSIGFINRIHFIPNPSTYVSLLIYVV
jgi:hypothetical protein